MIVEDMVVVIEEATVVEVAMVVVVAAAMVVVIEVAMVVEAVGIEEAMVVVEVIEEATVVVEVIEVAVEIAADHQVAMVEEDLPMDSHSELKSMISAIMVSDYFVVVYSNHCLILSVTSIYWIIITYLYQMDVIVVSLSPS